MSVTLTNGRQRKSLADQIDRLDSVLDGLAEGLNQAVADAVREAVRAVLTEVLTNPELLARLAAAEGVVPVAPSRGSGMLGRVWSGLRSAFRRVADSVHACRLSVGRAFDAGCRKVWEGGRQIKRSAFRMAITAALWALRVRPLLGPALSALALGGMTGLAATYGDPWAAGAVSAVGGLGIGLCPATGQSWLARFWPWRASVEES